MICEERLRHYNPSNLNSFNYLPCECDPLLHHCFDIGSDLVSLRPKLHSCLYLATAALFYDSVGFVNPCECLFKAPPVAQLLTLIQHALHLLHPLCAILLIISGFDFNHCLTPEEVCIGDSLYLTS